MIGGFTMLQFYFLSVLLNALAGYLLFFEDGGALDFKSAIPVSDETFKFVTGILSAFTGLFKLLSPIQGDVPLIGDIVPAITGVLCGFILIFEYYSRRNSVDDMNQAKIINGVLAGNKKIIGIAALAAAVLHFLFPTVLLL